MRPSEFRSQSRPADVLRQIVNSSRIRNGTVDPALVIKGLRDHAIQRAADADKATADIEELRRLAEGIHSGEIEIPEPRPLHELARQARFNLFERK